MKLVYPRDHSFYAHSHGGSASRFHFKGKNWASACGRSRLLDDTGGMTPESVPTVLRCRARGCAEKWPTEEHV